MADDKTPMPHWYGDSKFVSELPTGYSKRAPHLPRVVRRAFPSVQVPRKVFTPPTAGVGPRTIGGQQSARPVSGAK